MLLESYKVAYKCPYKSQTLQYGASSESVQNCLKTPGNLKKHPKVIHVVMILMSLVLAKLQ